MPHPAAVPAGSLQRARGDIRSPGRRVCAAAGGTRTPFQQQKCTFPGLWERLAAISPSSAFNSLLTQHCKAPGLVFPVRGYGCRGTGWALCPGTRCQSTASSATLTVTAQEAGHGLLNNPFLLLGSSQRGKISCPPRALGKESVQSSHTGHRLCLPNPPPRHSARTSLVILVAPRTAQPAEEPSCHHGNAEREGLKPAGTFNFCQEKQGP